MIAYSEALLRVVVAARELRDDCSFACAICECDEGNDEPHREGCSRAALDRALAALDETQPAPRPSVAIEAGPLLYDIPASAPGSEPASACVNCGTETDEPHSWEVCARILAHRCKLLDDRVSDPAFRIVAGGGGWVVLGDAAAADAGERISPLLRALGSHLADRECGPSLDGYGLCDGLIAAADLLDGMPGPSVHADQGATNQWPPLVPLAALLRRLEQRGANR